MALHCGGGAAAARVGKTAIGGAGRAWRSGDGVGDFGGWLLRFFGLRRCTRVLLHLGCTDFFFLRTTVPIHVLLVEYLTGGDQDS